MPDFLPDPLVSALLELSDPVPIEPAPALAPAKKSPRRGGAAVAAVALTAGIVLGAAAAPGPTPSTAASNYTIKVFGAAGGAATPPDTAVASSAPSTALTDDALASGAPTTGTAASADDDTGTADGTGVPDADSGAPSTGDNSNGGSPAADTPPANPPVEAPGPVWLISAGAVDLNDAIATRPALRTLAAYGRVLPAYKPLDDASLANGVALLSGKSPNESFSAEPTIAGQLAGTNRAWKAYVEDLGAACSSAPVNDYDPDRNPFVHFSSISPADCVDRDVDLGALSTDLENAATTPTLSWIVPDKTNDGTGPDGVAALETFLINTISQITATPAYQGRGLIAIVPDRPPSLGQPSGALLLSPSLQPGTDPLPYGPFSLLRGLEDRLGLPALGHAGDPTSSPNPIPSH